MDGVYRRIPRKVRKKKNLLLLVISTPVFLLLVLIFVLISVGHSQAEVVLVPQACLGGWNNPTHASGAIDVTDRDTSKFSDSNSSSVSNTLADIFCGDFSGDIPKDTKPTAITVSFSWALVPHTPTDMISVSPHDLASSTNNVLDAAAQTTGSNDSTSSSSIPEDINSPRIVPMPLLIHSPTSSDVQTATSSQSIITNILLALLAPEIAHADSGTTTPFLMHPPLMSIGSTSEAAFATSSVDDRDPATTTPISDDAILSVSYTLDGTIWHDLGIVTRSNLSFSSFVIPVDSVPEWSDLQRLQIRISSLSTIGGNDTIYLDGMSLHVDFAKTSQEIKDREFNQQKQDFIASLPTLPLTVSAIVNSGQSFAASAVSDTVNKQTLRFSDKEGGNVIVYQGVDHIWFMNSGLGVESLDMPLYFFPPDSYTVIDVSNANDCPQTATIDQCRAAPSYRGESMFSTALASSTAVSSGNATMQTQ
jgi:hypothetical protein